MDISNAKQLSEILENRSDEEIIKTVSDLGVEDSLEKVFEGMEKAFLPDQAAGQSAIIQWDVQAPGGPFRYQLKVENGACKSQKNGTDKARVTLAVELPTFLRVITGKVNGQQAFFTGKLKLSGDMMFAMTQEKWFDKNWGG